MASNFHSCALCHHTNSALITHSTLSIWNVLCQYLPQSVPVTCAVNFCSTNENCVFLPFQKKRMAQYFRQQCYIVSIQSLSTENDRFQRFQSRECLFHYHQYQLFIYDCNAFDSSVSTSTWHVPLWYCELLNHGFGAGYCWFQYDLK